MKLRSSRKQTSKATPAVVDYMVPAPRAAKKEPAFKAPKFRLPPVRLTYRTGFAAALILLVLVASVYGFTHVGYASTTEFYPSTCLGSWSDTQHAAGEPDVKNQDQRADFTSENSSVVHNTQGNIYCGGFAGKIPAETQPAKITVHFSWTIKGNEEDAPAAAPNIDASSSAASSTGNTIPDTNGSSTPSGGEGGGAGTGTSAPADTAPAQPTDTSPAPTPKDTSSAPVTPTPTPVPQTVTPSTEPTSSPTPANSTAPTSAAPDSAVPAPAPTTSAAPSADASVSLGTVLQALFFTPVYAQEVPQTSSSTNAGTGDTQDNTSSSTPAATSSDTTLPLPPSAPPGALLAVRYTTDGIVWNDLGTVTKDQMANATFTIPTAGLEKWQDLSKLQVSVQTLPTLDAPTIYLDSLWLSIDYKDQSQTPEQPLVFKGLSTASHDVELRTHDDETPDQKLIIASITGNVKGLAVYRDESPGAPFLHTYVEDTYYIVAASTFPVGAYTAVITNDPNHCANLNLSSCETDPQFIARASFSVASSTAAAPMTSTNASSTISGTEPASLSSTTPSPDASSSAR